MQNLVTQPSAKRNYDFVDTIRCIAMIFIVMEHSTYFEPNVYLPTDGLRALCYYLTLQFSKFGTVCFFLLAGFLIGDKFTDYGPLQYLKRRIGNTIRPWLFWSLVFVYITNSDIIINKIIFRPDPKGVNVWQTLGDAVTTTYLYTNYWFIPNFLFCISLLLVFKKYLYSYIFGGILCLCTFFYSVNIYFSWIAPTHTLAIFGFVFFLWLGAQFNKNWTLVNAWINKTSLSLWVILAFLSLCFAMAEMYWLRNLHVHDPYNSLRFSNIIYSLCVFFMLLKIRDFKFIHKLKPRETTYGFYLIHYVVLFYLGNKIFYPMQDHLFKVYQLPIALVFVYQIVKFILVYSCTYFIIWLINRSKYKWLIGR